MARSAHSPFLVLEMVLMLMLEVEVEVEVEWTLLQCLLQSL